MAADKVRVGLVGFGYWGTNLLRNLVMNPRVEVAGVVDPSASARQRSQQLWPQIPVFDRLDSFLEWESPDAMVIATPPALHAPIAIRCLEAGAHVLVEKPLAISVEECDEILAAGERANRIVMVDHTFVYHPAVQCLVKQIQAGELGELLYFDSVRANLGGFQPGINVCWDLAPHDLSILDQLTGGRMPREVSAHGVKHFGSTVETLCYAHLNYPGQFVGHLHMNWAAPVKIRQIMVAGIKKMVSYDDNCPVEKIKIYDQGPNLINPSREDFRVSYRKGGIWAPALPSTEALATVVDQFVDSIRTGVAPLTDGRAGRRIVAILEALSESMKRDGQPVRLKPEITSTTPMSETPSRESTFA